MLKNFCDFVRKHFYFGIQPITWVAIAVALSIIPCLMFLPEKYGYENGLLENLQLIALFIGVYLAVKPKGNKQFFYFAAMVLGILILREVNCGRTLFFPVPGTENSFYSWKDIKYGYLAHPIYGAYMAYVAFYFIKNKLYIPLWEMLKNTTIPVINIVLMLIGMGVGMYAEKALKNMILEETTELLFYVSLVGIIYLYSRVKRFMTEN